MEKLSSLLLLLSLVTTNIYVSESLTITASVLTQMGFTNQSTYVNIRTNNNDIDSIDPNALNGYDKLIRLDIFSNQLSTIDIEIFKGAVNLEELIILCPSLNQFTNSKNIKLLRVTRLYFQNGLTSFNKPMFSAFPALEFFQTPDYGGVTKTIDVHTFESFSNLISLYLGSNKLTSFEYLQIPKNLKVLNLEYNNMNYFALSRTMGVLEGLYINNNRFRSFKSMDFTFLANLTELYLSNNPHAYPYEIAGHLKPLVKLLNVALVNLSISTIDPNYFKYNTNLWSIDLRLNNISSLDNRTFNGLNNLRSINLGYNYLTKISSGTFVNRYLSGVELGKNQISQIEPSSFKGSFDFSVSLASNKLTKILPGTFNNSFSYIELGNNQLTEIDNLMFDGVTYIKSLGLAYNKIEKIAPGSFKNIGSGEINLSNNNLTELRNMTFVGQIGSLRIKENRIEKIEEGAFNYATFTERIVLSYNSLTEINASMFAGQNQIKEIYLNNNKLSKIESGSFANLPNLKYVYLDYNQLTQLDSLMFAGSNNLNAIYLPSNPSLSTANIQSLCPPAATNCHVYY